MFRTALIGCGAIAQTHADNLSRMENVSLVGICDIIPEKAEALKQKFGFLSAPVYTDYRKMLDEVKPDVVHICTPHYLHAEMAIEALNRDIHVMLEKPVCLSPDEFDLLLKAEQNSKAKICVSFQNRFLERNEKLKSLVLSGEYGKILSAVGTCFWKREGAYYTESPWRGRLATEGGGVLINQSIHTLDLLLWICGMPERIAAITANLHQKGIIETEDTAVLRLVYPEGFVGLFFATNGNSVSAPVSLEIRCEKGVLSIRDGDLWINDEPQHLKDPVKVSTGKADWGVGHRHLFDSFYAALEKGENSPVSVQDAYRAVSVLRAAYRSNGEEIPITGRE